MAARLEITDGTTTIDLIQTGGNPFYLNYWRPSIIQPKGGGTYQQSSLSDGRRLVDRKYNNATETFDISVRGDDPDALAAALHDLRVLLEKAVSYWITNYQDVPVYLIAQSDCEENERYAIIHNWSTPEDENPYSQPFQQSDQAAVMDSWTLLIERGDWLENVPGESTCVQISGSQDVAIGTDVIAYPTASTDDAFVNNTAGTIDTGGVGIGFGETIAAEYDGGIRFRDVQVPPGATISSAFVRFTASENQAVGVIRLVIYGERNDEPAAFSSYADFAARNRTSTYVNWFAVPAWTAGNTYDTSDITDIIQEIVNLGNWEQGDDLVIFVEDNGSDGGAYRVGASWDNVTYDEPELHVTFADRVAGRTATCDNEVYVANKHNMAQLTDVYVDNGGVFGTNLIGAVPPYNILPAVPAVDDAVYFGIDTTLADTGPFCSLVFDLSVAQNDCTIEWEYWTGAAWGGMSLQDNTDTDGAMTGDPFDTTGVNSVHWEQQPAWQTTAVNLVTGYWVRARVSAIGAAPSPPTQQNRDVYTITWPYTEIQADQVRGDIPALARLLVENQSWGSGASDLFSGRVLFGLRSLSRGEDFTAFINISNEQNNAGFTVSASGGDTSFVDKVDSPTGRVARYNPVAISAMAERATVSFSDALSVQYYGTFRLYLRVDARAGASADDFAVQLGINFGSEVLTDTVSVSDTAEGYVLDFGRVDIAPRIMLYSDEFWSSFIRIYASCSDATGDLDFQDLILMPVDEFAVDSLFLEDVLGRTQYLDFDSIVNPKVQMRSLLRRRADDEVVSFWRSVKNNSAMLQANAAQRFWFFHIDANDDAAEFETANSVQMYRNQRYFSYRGAL